MIKQIFVNLPVKHLEKTKQFWTQLGFSFNPQFTGENAAALILGDNIFAMLLLPEFFKRFTQKTIADAQTTTEAINSLSCESRQEVDEIQRKAMQAGGRETRPADDYGWMYGRSFEDLDGHQWELAFMDLSQAPAEMGGSS